MNEKIALIIPANIWFCPFIRIYTKLFDEFGINYDIISWDRANSNEEGTISYKGKVGQSTLTKLSAYYKYSQFVKKKISETNYTKLVVFTSQVGIFCSKYLKKHYRGKYIFDFRDLSIEQFKPFQRQFRILLGNSYSNVISSPGFKRRLPSGYKYFLSHNFDISDVEKHITPVGVNLPNKPIDILTIGGIRDYSSNAPLMDSMGNNPEFQMRFVGKGCAAQMLEEHCHKLDYKNVLFEGFYQKKDEYKYIKDCSFLNIYYPDTIIHATALSNRFYNSLIYRKPMIVTKGQIQGDYCEQYNLGIAVKDINDLPVQIHFWLNNNDFSIYEKRCIELLEKFMLDYSEFKKMVKSFCE